MKRISVIIPVYNASAYLKKCLESILNQTLKDIEVIAINDGSTDDSLEILKRMSLEDERLIVISQSNQGQGKARNVGINKACSQTVTFCDSDDYFENRDIFAKMYNKFMKDKSDLVVAGAKIVDISSRESILSFTEEKMIDINKDEGDFYLNWYQDSRFMTSCCNKLYKTDIIKNNEIIFNDYTKVFSEDTLFNYRYIAECRKVSIIPDYGYVQIMRASSSSTTRKDNDILRYINMIDEMVIYTKLKDSEYYKDVCFRYILTGADILILVHEYHNDKINKKSAFEITSKIFSSKMQGILPKELPKHRRVFNKNIQYYRLLFMLQNANFINTICYIVFIKAKVRNLINGKKGQR